MVASMDLGIKVLAGVPVNDGMWLLHKGVRTKEDYFYFERRIAGIQSLAVRTKNINEYDAYLELNRDKRSLLKKLTRRLLRLYRNFAPHLLKKLCELGVSTNYSGYTLSIEQDKGNKFTSSVWSYRKLMEAIELKSQEHGMIVYVIVEYDTFRYCAFHGVEAKSPRGVVNRPLDHKLHLDLSGALNIL